MQVTWKAWRTAIMAGEPNPCVINEKCVKCRCIEGSNRCCDRVPYCVVRSWLRTCMSSLVICGKVLIIVGNDIIISIYKLNISFIPLIIVCRVYYVCHFVCNTSTYTLYTLQSNKHHLIWKITGYRGPCFSISPVKMYNLDSF